MNPKKLSIKCTPALVDEDGCLGGSDGYYHFNGAPRIVRGNDNYDTGYEFRGDAVVIPVWNEHGYTEELVLGFHKGNIYIYFANEKVAEGEDFPREGLE